jgi:hypothetical protein
LSEKGNKYIDEMRIDSYDNFHLLMNEILAENKFKTIIEGSSDMFCLESSDVSSKIYKDFID